MGFFPPWNISPLKKNALPFLSCKNEKSAPALNFENKSFLRIQNNFDIYDQKATVFKPSTFLGIGAAPNDFAFRSMDHYFSPTTHTHTSIFMIRSMVCHIVRKYAFDFRTIEKWHNQVISFNLHLKLDVIFIFKQP